MFQSPFPFVKLPNGLRYRRVGGRRQRHFTGTNSKPRKLPENAATPTRRVHAVLGGALSRLNPQLLFTIRFLLRFSARYVARARLCYSRRVVFVLCLP